jgi:CRISPR-associated protein Cas1
MLDPETSPDVPDLVPARMLNEFTYCPRLAYLEWVQGDFADSADTVEGRFHHRKVDKESGDLPAPDALPEAAAAEKLHARSIYLSAPKVGLVARIDLVEGAGTIVTPVDYKRGEAPNVPEGAWEPERVQLCAQGLILEENGYSCREGVLYFVASRKRVTIPFTLALRTRTLELLASMRETMASATIPPPLQDSPKCPRCSLVGICLPDEINLLRIGGRPDGEATDETGEPPAEPGEPRRLLPARDDALPLYVQAAGTRVGKSGDELTVQPREGERQMVRIGQTSQVALFGQVQISTQAIQAALGREIPITYFTAGGWFYGITAGLSHKNVDLRRLQFRAADDPALSLSLAKKFVIAKILNARTLLRRNGEGVPAQTIDMMRALAEDAATCTAAASLLGIEGTAARVYFQSFSRMLKRHDGDADGLAFDFAGRNRRPARDPVNALLSLAYALLAKDLTVVTQAVGFDPFLGFYHRPRYGRPALALDLMEEFRPIISDSIALTAINTGVVQPADFISRAGAVSLKEHGRTRFLRLYERRMDELVTHPIFGYRICYRRVLEVQARLLARFLAGEIPEYPGFQTR